MLHSELDTTLYTTQSPGFHFTRGKTKNIFFVQLLILKKNWIKNVMPVKWNIHETTKEEERLNMCFICSDCKFHITPHFPPPQSLSTRQGGNAVIFLKYINCIISKSSFRAILLQSLDFLCHLLHKIFNKIKFILNQYTMSILSQTYWWMCYVILIELSYFIK